MSWICIQMKNTHVYVNNFCYSIWQYEPFFLRHTIMQIIITIIITTRIAAITPAIPAISPILLLSLLSLLLLLTLPPMHDLRTIHARHGILKFAKLNNCISNLYARTDTIPWTQCNYHIRMHTYVWYSSKVTLHSLALFFQVVRCTRSCEESIVTRTRLDIVCEFLFLEALEHVCLCHSQLYKSRGLV